MEEIKKTKKGNAASKNTFYRVTLRNQINLVQIADQKANIIIGINTVIISLIIAVLGWGFNVLKSEIFNNLDYSFPLIMLMLFCLTSGMFSILGARPMGPKVENNKQGILYFNKDSKYDSDCDWAFYKTWGANQRKYHTYRVAVTESTFAYADPITILNTYR